MVITEALAHGVPVLATDVGGVPEALGHGAGGQRPGLLLPAGDPTALADALRGWLDSSELRDHLRKTAGERRSTLVEWPTTSERISRILDEVRS
jgi:glycosyltransferase involved in cell wall biosynthesis